MSEKRENTTDNKDNRINPSIGVTNVWLILTVVILVIIILFLGYSFFTESLVLKSKELALWFLFMLFAAAISCIFGAITSHSSQRSEENREISMVQEIKSFLNEKTDEINNNVNIALKRGDLFSGDQEDILDKLMNCCLDIGEKIDRIRILAQDSGTFSEFFTEHFKDRPFECRRLEILIQCSDINENNPIINEWMRLFNAKKNDIKTMQIRRTSEIKLRSLFGMVIEFEQEHHSIGMIGFYEPQKENGNNKLIPFSKRYGVLSGKNSFLEVIDEYFIRYFDNAERLKDVTI